MPKSIKVINQKSKFKPKERLPLRRCRCRSTALPRAAAL
jgi:hypothetical protein